MRWINMDSYCNLNSVKSILEFYNYINFPSCVIKIKITTLGRLSIQIK